MSGIVTLVLDREGDGLRVSYFASDGVTVAEQVRGMQAALEDLQRKAMEAEVERRVAVRQAEAGLEGLGEIPPKSTSG